MLPIALFAVAAVAGGALAIRHFQRKGLPMPLALGHGAFAAAGLVALLVVGTSGSLGSAWPLALGLLMIAAVGGFVLFAMHLRKVKLSSPVVLAHAAAAVAGFVVLLVAAFG